MSCDALHPCWEQYGEHQRSFVSSKLVEGKLYTMLGLAHSMPLEPTFEQIQHLEEACRDYADVLNERWRNCVRQPFDFPVFNYKVGSGGLLAQLGLLKLVEPIKRRV